MSDPIIPSYRRRPGGGNTPFDPHYIEGLQNRNKTNLLDVLGSAPPLVEEIIPETYDMLRTKQTILKAIHTSGRWISELSGYSSFLGGMTGATQKAQNKVLNQVLYPLETLFAPIQGILRGIQMEYEQFITQYETGAAIGSIVGAALGYAVGYIYLGPLGSQVLGWFGNVAGGFIGGRIQKDISEMATWDFKKWIDMIWGTSGAGEGTIEGGWVHHEGESEKALQEVPYGGAPIYREIGTTYNNKKRLARKLTNMEALYR